MSNASPVLTACLVLIAAAACGRDAAGPSACLPSSVQQQVRDVAPLKMTLTNTPEAMDAELIERLAAADGRAVILFKEPASPRTLESVPPGRGPDGQALRVWREAVSAATIRSALDELCRAGVEVEQYFWIFGSADVVLSPEQGPELRRAPYVDFLLPRNDDSRPSLRPAPQPSSGDSR